MYIKDKQTLFYMFGDTNTIRLFDLKTISNLDFDNMSEAIAFCKHYNEIECLSELLNSLGHETTCIYLETNDKTKKHKVIRTFRYPSIMSLTSEELYTKAKRGDVMNVELGNTGKLKIKWLFPKANQELKKKVRKQYKEFITNMKLIGKNVEFKYEIISNYVILTNAKPKHELIVPGFITSIACYYNYSNYSVKKMVIIDGVRFIGSWVIDYDTEVVYGNTVEYIGNAQYETNVRIIK